MRLQVHHTTHYAYPEEPGFLVQRLLLTPADFDGQTTEQWNISAPGIETALRHVDHAGNISHLVTSRPPASFSITASGIVETRDTAGVVRGLPAQSPEALYLRVTPMTEADAALRDFAAAFAGRAPALQRAHDLMAAVHKALAYEVGTSHAGTTAVEAFKAGRGVCQDHAHVMIAAARRAGFPARYVTGYLVTGVGAGSAAAHAWAEVFIPDLGWVGFDAANGQCPTDHYVRLAGGLDATAVPPIRGSRRGLPADEHLRVEVSVDIAQQ